MQDRKLRRIGIMSFVLATTLVAPMPAAAAGPVTSAASASLTAQATPTKGRGGVQPASTIVYQGNPWGCYDDAQNPHLSTHYPGTVAALALQKCPGYKAADLRIHSYPDTPSFEAWLYYESCFLIFCGWNQVDHWSISIAYPASELSHTLAANCNNGNSTKWRLYARGTAYGFNGSQYATYSATVENIQTLACGH